jgi:hypothetical protein
MQILSFIAKLDSPCCVQVSCSCNAWFAGKNCQINLKLLLIVGAVSASLMMIIACGVSCFCCKDRRKRNIPSKYSKSFSRREMRKDDEADNGTRLIRKVRAILVAIPSTSKYFVQKY